MTGQFSIVGGDQIPTACRKDEDGTVARTSLRTMTRVTSVMPIFFCAPPYMISAREPEIVRSKIGIGKTYKDDSVFADINFAAQEIGAHVCD